MEHNIAETKRYKPNNLLTNFKCTFKTSKCEKFEKYTDMNNR